MSVHFFHTSDWHLGQFFHGHPRHYEHEQFLAWLLEQIQSKQPNALLIAGDIFDVINPGAQAQKQLYQFLADVHQLAPNMQTLMIAGNHDSGYRIEQVEPLLEKYRAKSVGILQRNTTGQPDLERLIVPIYDINQKIIAWCIALPFLRPAEITGYQEFAEDSQTAIAHLHEKIIALAKVKAQPDQALILMSHAHLQGSETSDSERPIVIGNEEALSTQLFSDGIDYVALGHLHKPQQVGATNIRYSGSPIPLSFSEVRYPHQILDVTIDPLASEQRLDVHSIRIPRFVDLIPVRGELNDVLQKIQQLEHGEFIPVEQRHFVDVEYYSHSAPPLDLRQQIEQALPDNRYRLVRLARKLTDSTTSSTQGSKIDLAPPTPQQLFQQLWHNMGHTPDTQVEQDFISLLHEAEQQQHSDH
ncbi:exonuclease subunit SbcD [Acinetobacter qingfengensis]|uniref:Nuclease SbcCD subunit D n=1 Tax=Acinetobacter qingfengensis TaxID=1262585 RepID=A0A1E7REN1_9GAMM|nr:exonuclease SbcCD subunit D C-terminal domain-containing protein [Acinetobacter qingfengensis]KAA8735031.1 exonuclease subunit SbcD [Acinetobacter qingfengensis]OEY97753.1 exonuclease sbcCD subunit D [Acinetobacter qingfengensis]